jgi:hypothetical protein
VGDGVASFALLVGFALLKIVVGVGIVWLGVRAAQRPEDDDGGYGPFAADGSPPRPGGRRPAARARPRTAARLRGRPDRFAGRRAAPNRIRG